MLPLIETINTVCVLFAGLFTMLMFAGFTLFTAGLIRAKNATTLLTANMVSFSVGCLIYFLIGFQLMFLNPAGTSLYFPDVTQLFDLNYHWSNYLNHPLRAIDQANAFFQFSKMILIIAIVAGVTAERVKLWTLVWFSIVMAGVIYPVVGYWCNSGFLKEMGFIDLAGAGQIHLTAAIAALMGFFLVGRRAGKYNQQQKIIPIAGSNIPLAVMGMFLILIGSLSLNSGHYFTIYDVSGGAISQVALAVLNTLTSIVTCTVMFSLLARILFGKVDITLMMNGAILGLVVVSAIPVQSSLTMTVISAVVSSAIVFLCIVLLDKAGLDDPIGGISVHGIGGIVSLLIAASVGQANFLSFFKQLMVQLNGIFIIVLWVAATSIITWILLKLLLGMRISLEAEGRGLDIIDCGVKAYPEFVVDSRR